LDGAALLDEEGRDDHLQSTDSHSRC
jgi:hypothetical protein